MTPSNQTGSFGEPARHSGGKAFLAALALAILIGAGALVSTTGTGAIHEALRNVGFGLGPQIEAEQHRQAALIGELGRKLRSVTTDVAIFAAHDDRLAGEFDGRLAQLDKDLATLRAETATRNTRPGIAAAETWRDEIGTLKGNLAQAKFSIVDLRSSLDASEQVNRRDIADINKRIDQLERVVAGNLTASIPPTPAATPKRHPYRVMSGWTVQVAHNSTYISGQSGTYEVAPGSVVPGLGRIVSVRRSAKSLIVVTARGVIIQR